MVIVTEAVLDELESTKDNALSNVEAAIKQGWIETVQVDITDNELVEILDPGEASAILYSLSNDFLPILIDDNKGKRYARKQGIPVIGTAGVLIKAKKEKIIPLVRPIFLDMKSKGYFLSDSFINTVAAMVDA